MKKEEFSVLMSVYIKEKPEYFDSCMKSIFEQTIMPNEIVIVFDGPVDKNIEDIIDEYNSIDNIIKVKKNTENKGLGLALADGAAICSNKIIARMDTDDICREDRFEIQLKYLKEHPEVDIVGCHIEEFGTDVSDLVSMRRVPLEHDDIVKYQKKRSAFNHMTVMMKKDALDKAGGYQDAPLMEDDLLWANMIMTGAKCANIDDVLVFARVGSGMIGRRGSFSYYKKYKSGRKKILETGFISYFDYLVTLCIQFIVALIPDSIRTWVFRVCLRQKIK